MERELIAEHFVNLYDLSFEQAEKVLMVQRKSKKKKIDEIAIELGFLEPKKPDEYLDTTEDRNPAQQGNVQGKK